MPYLVLIRHGQSIWNAEGKWTGLTDIALNDAGHKESVDAASYIKDISFQVAFTSVLIRAKETLEDILASLNQTDITVKENAALNERDYGDYTTQNKWQVKKQLGDVEFTKLRRAWDYPLPNGESLKDVYERVLPYYQNYVLPELKENKNVLLVAHGNSIRALIKFLDGISDDKIAELEVATGEVYVYEIDQTGKVVKKEIRNK